MNVTLSHKDAVNCYDALYLAIRWYNQQIDAEIEPIVKLSYKVQRDKLQATANLLESIL
jgi:hypothetical protein